MVGSAATFARRTVLGRGAPADSSNPWRRFKNLRDELITLLLPTPVGLRVWFTNSVAIDHVELAVDTARKTLGLHSHPLGWVAPFDLPQRINYVGRTLQLWCLSIDTYVVDILPEVLPPFVLDPIGRICRIPNEFSGSVTVSRFRAKYRFMRSLIFLKCAHLGGRMVALS